LYGRLGAHDDLQPGTENVERINRLRSDNLLLNAFWRFTPDPRLTTRLRVFALNGGLQNLNRNTAVLDDRDSRQIGFRYDAAYVTGAHQIEAGTYVRSTRERRYTNSFPASQPLIPRLLEDFARRATEDSYYLQDTWKHERFSLTAGGRVQHSGVGAQTAFQPRASMTWSPGSRWTLRAGAGSFAQFPALDQLFGYFGNPGLRAERATHFNLGVERLIGARIRIFADLYDREDRSQIFSFWEPHLMNNRAVANFVRYGNLVRGYARGGEAGVQRRSANGLTGWISYGWMTTRYQDRADALEFVGDFDQRHTVSAFANYRFRPTIDAGVLWRYGSGQPVPGFIRRDGTSVALADLRNTTRLPYYNRVDLRVNKAFLFRRWKLTLSGEVLNVLGRQNVIVIATDPVRIFSSGRFSAGLEDSFGVLPSARVAFEF
jgi:outer membrane cobalamin receptor